MKVFVSAVALGFPIALILAWAFEITPEGIVRAEDVLPNETSTRRAGRKLTGVIIILACVALGFFLFQQFRRTSQSAGTTTAPNLPTIAEPVLEPKSIAVLPFANLSDDKQNAYFADGVQDEILTELARI